MTGFANPLRAALGAQFFKELPRTPGVYFMLGPGGRLLYIGKAKNLKARLRTYAQLKPGNADDRLLEMIAHVRIIRWENHPTERRALAREADLLRVFKPPYNVAGTGDEFYLYLGIRESVCRAKTGGVARLEFRLSNWPDFEDEGYEIFGAYRSRRKVKAGYAALLRLIHCYQCSGARFSYPAKISREKPPWQYEMRFPRELHQPLRDFLRGSDRNLLTLIFAGLLANEAIPAFMRPSIQDDIDAVKILFRAGPRVSRDLRRRHGLRAQLVRPEQMDELIGKDVLGTLQIGSDF